MSKPERGKELKLSKAKAANEGREVSLNYRAWRGPWIQSHETEKLPWNEENPLINYILKTLIIFQENFMKNA